MPMFQALELCPHATVIAPDMAKYKRVSEDIRTIFASATSIIEPRVARRGLPRPHRRLPHGGAAGGGGAGARSPAAIESEVGITVSIGLACNKFLAKLASELEKPRGFSAIGRAEAKAFLAPLSVRKIHGVGAVTARRMEEGGLATIADLQALSEQELAARFGKFGHRLAQFAHGDDDRQVTPYRPVKSISAETTFAKDTGSAPELCEIARRLSDRVAAQLARKGVAGTSIVLKLKTSDFQLLTRSRRLAYPTQKADVIFESVAALIERETDGRTFRLIGVGVAIWAPRRRRTPPTSSASPARLPTNTERSGLDGKARGDICDRACLPWGSGLRSFSEVSSWLRASSSSARRRPTSGCPPPTARPMR